MKNIDVVAICNALVDVLIEANDRDIEKLGMQKGGMMLVDTARQYEVLQSVKGKDQTIELGGSAMNLIRSLASLNCKTSFAGCVGEDDFGDRIATRMHQLGIKPHLMKQNESTGSCLILVTPDGERTMNTHLGASRLYDESLVPHEDIKKAKILHFCGYQWDSEAQKNAITKAIETARKNETLISFDLADPFVVERHRSDLWKIIEEDADIVFANRREAQLLFEEDPWVTAGKIANTGAIAVIKLGAEGALVQNGKEPINISPVPTKVIDTTAAGDMFAAGFLYGLLKGLSLKDCGNIAALLASDVISRMGATVSNDALAKAEQLALDAR